MELCLPIVEVNFFLADTAQINCFVMEKLNKHIVNIFINTVENFSIKSKKEVHLFIRFRVIMKEKYKKFFSIPLVLHI